VKKTDDDGWRVRGARPSPRACNTVDESDGDGTLDREGRVQAHAGEWIERLAGEDVRYVQSVVSKSSKEQIRGMQVQTRRCTVQNEQPEAIESGARREAARGRGERKRTDDREWALIALLTVE